MNSPINDLEKLEIDKLPESFKARVIHENPYIVKIKNFLTDEEVNELLKLAEGKFERSNIVIDGKLVITNSRTSSTAYILGDGLPDQYSKPIEKLIKRIRYLMSCKREQIEGLMCVRYKYQEKFDAHFDYFKEDEIGVLDKGGQRIATFFVYLNDLHSGEGGETEFVRLGIKSKPRKGDAIFWWNRDPRTGSMLPETEHRGNPVEKKGIIKYGLNIWIRERKFR